MDRIIIVGAGGHGHVVADALGRQRAGVAPGIPIGFVDDRTELHGRTVLGLPILGGLACLALHGHDSVVVAIGDCRIRASLYRSLATRGERFATVTHESSVIASDVIIGPGSMVLAGVIVNTGSSIGANVILNTGCILEHHNLIGDHAHVAPGATLGGEVRAGECSLIGIGATILPRCRVGDRSVVGGGAVVIGDVPSGVIVTGVPARVSGSLR